MYWFQSVSEDMRLFQHSNRTTKLVLTSIFSSFAAIFQAAGGFLPGIGLFMSPLATAPILLSSMMSLPLGLMSYGLTILLLVILEPTELVIFPFTTGLLGLGLGIAFTFFKKRITIITTGAISLTLGIISLLYVFQFPVLGPIASQSFSFLTTGGILVGSFLYSWLWMEIALVLFRRLIQLQKLFLR